jgi:aspartyl aminopeptidase
MHMPHPSDAPLARNLMQYIDASPTPFHAVSQTAQRLEAAGFTRVDESAAWQLAPGARVYTTRNGSSVCAFVIGERPVHEAGFALVGAHTDSPNLRVKPVPDVRAYGYHQLAVEVYGGVLWHTWLDRDLSLAGRVVIDDGSASGSARLVDFRRPLLRIPNLAIHLNRTVNSEGLKLNAQSHLLPVVALDTGAQDRDALFTSALAAELTRAGQPCEGKNIVSWDLALYDTQPSVLGGLHDEFIFAPRLDNLASCHAALQALCAGRSGRAETRGIVLYDHEEVGSHSAQGATSPFLLDALSRIAESSAGGATDALPRALARSLMISADMAHAVHPNYADRHEPGHRPVLGQGPVLKTNVSQSYASDAATRARFQLLCRSVEVTPQHFVSRNDFACGSTIGPLTAARVGLPTVDVGNPLLSMHSVREMAATADVATMQKVLDAFFA